MQTAIPPISPKKKKKASNLWNVFNAVADYETHEHAKLTLAKMWDSAARGTGEQESASGICNSCHKACGSTWLITYRSRWAGSATGQLNYSAF
ncbi:hypothetical protein R3I94_016381 [Phoxinus phoxinus]